jgi:hypothetical protein
MNNGVLHINRSIMAGVEKRVITFLIGLLPKWVTPDMLTVLGFYGAIGCGIAYILSDGSIYFLYVSSFMILLNWYGDSLDGGLAYYQKRENQAFGIYFDHIIDAFSILAVCLGLTISSLTFSPVWIFFAFGYVLFELHVTLAGWSSHSYMISTHAIGPTEMRLILIFFNFFGVFLARNIFYLMGTPYMFFDLLGFVACFILFALLLIDFVATMRKLRKPFK